MLGVVIASIVTLVVGYMILKKYKAQVVLLSGSLILMICTIVFGLGEILPAKESTGFIWFDIFDLIRKTLSTRIAGLGLAIMTVGGFVHYMNHIGASKALVIIAVKPLEKLHAPYVVMACSYLVGQFLGLFINSASGLSMLLMLTMFPILIQLGVSRLSAAAVVATTLSVDWSPANVGPMLASSMSGIDVITYWINYQVPVALAIIGVITVLHFVVQQWFDKKSGHVVARREIAATVSEEECPPAFYFLLPILPLALLLTFSKFLIKGIKLDIIDALLISLFISMLCEFIRYRNLTKVFSSIQVFFDGMGAQFAAVVTLVVSGEFFALGLTKIGAIDTILKSAQGGFGPVGMLIVMVIIISGSTIVMGSGNAAFLTFANLIPAIAEKMSIYPPLMLVPMEFASSIARSVSPITAVIVVVSGIAKISPIDLIKRTAIPMLGAAITNVAITLLLFYK